ncbi:MAG: carbohydrate porin [Nitrospinae bacterium]|nr:carbohydrate porin [Nitrospinota bacterium]
MAEEKAAMEQGLFERDKLTGDWGGLRSAMEDKGLSFEIVYKGEFARLFTGGVEPNSKTMYLDNLDLKFTLDTEKAGMWEGGALFFHGLANNGDDPSTFVGDTQVTSNIESNDTTRVYQLWYEQTLYDKQLAILFGLHDFNSEFFTSEYAGLFLNSSFGIGPSVSHAVPVSIFNVSAIGLRIKAELAENFGLLAAVYDGNPGDPYQNMNGLDIKIDEPNEGLMEVMELQYGIGGEESAFLPGKYRLGVWWHTGKFEDVRMMDADGNPVVHKESSGFYITFDQLVYETHEGHGLAIFGQYGVAPKTHSQISDYFGGGLHYMGIFPGRDNDMAGIAVAYAKISDDLAQTSKDVDGVDLTAETTYEFTYRAEIFPWLFIQPDFQIVVNPGGDTNAKTAQVGYIRTQVNF